nr:uncharacterized protein LOC120976231 isoform X1 [Aegilops tauschii subsp. strangulata]
MGAARRRPRRLLHRPALLDLECRWSKRAEVPVSSGRLLFSWLAGGIPSYDCREERVEQVRFPSWRYEAHDCVCGGTRVSACVCFLLCYWDYTRVV